MQWVRMVAMVVCLLGGSLPGWASEPKNVILIVADDLNQMIGPLDDPNALTPHMDRLAARGVLFRNSICQYPLCAPSRASFLSGLYPWRVGLHQGGRAPATWHVLPNWVWMHDYFRENGYWAGNFGKVEHDLVYAKWDEAIRGGDPGRPVEDLVREKAFVGKGLSGPPLLKVYDSPWTDFSDGVKTVGALEAIERRSAEDQPFFIALGFDLPHSPWIIPEQFYDLYTTEDIVVPDEPPEAYSRWGDWAYPYGKGADKRPLMSTTDLQEMYQAYLGSVSYLDFLLGKVLDKLDELELWEDTVVVFMSDNGTSMMEHVHLFSKRNHSREALTAPMIVVSPDAGTPGSVCDRQVQLVDLLPTLVELAGVPEYPKALDGRSIVPLLEDPAAEWPWPAFSCSSYPSRTAPRVRICQLGEWKLVQGIFGISYQWVFNHRTDPKEWWPVSAANSEIDPQTLATMRNAFPASLPMRNGVFYVGFPDGLVYDRDGDGISDEWEVNLGSNPVVSDGHLDSDGDGSSNIAELRFGTEMDDPEDHFRIEAVHTPGEGAFFFRFHAREGRDYVIQNMQNGSWSDVLRVPGRGQDQGVLAPTGGDGAGLFRIRPEPH